MRDDERGPALNDVVRRCLDQALVLGVEVAGGLVHDEDARVAEDGARNTDALALAAGELDAALSDDGVVAVLRPCYELLGLCDGGSGGDFGPRSARTAVLDVFGDTAGEESNVLRHDGDLLAETALRHVAYVYTIDEDRALIGVEHAQKHVDERRLAAAAAADQRDGDSGRHAQADSLERPLLRAGVAEPDVAELYAFAHGSEHPGVWRVGDGGALVDDGEQPLGTGEAAAELRENDR